MQFIEEEVEVMAQKHPSFFGLHKQQTQTCRDSALLCLTSHFTSAASNCSLCISFFRSLYLDSLPPRSFFHRSFISRILFRCLSFDPVQSSFDNLVPHRLAQSLILAKEVKAGPKAPQPRRISALTSLEIAINVFSEVAPPLKVTVSMNVFSLAIS